MTEMFMRGHAAQGASLQVGSLFQGSQPTQLGLRIFVTFLRALHEARRRQAERDLRRHQYLLDRYASPPLREQART